MRYGLIIVVLVITGFCSFSQPFEKRIRFFSTQQGLSNKYINYLAKDDRGFLWIGTAEGLNRFDGKHFINFFNNPDDDNSLTGNVVYDILQYQRGRLLIATNNGLSVFNTRTNRFENDKIKTASLQKKSNTLVRSLFKDKGGHIYVNHSGKIDVFSDSLSFMYCLTDLPWCQRLRGIIAYLEPWFQDKKGRIWIPSDNMGINIIDITKQRVYNKTNNLYKFPFFDSDITRSIYYDEEKEQLFCSGWGTGLVKYDLKQDKIQYQLFNIALVGEERSINAIVAHKGRLICCGSRSLFSVNPETMAYEDITNGFHAIAPGAFSTSICALNDGTAIWVGTETKGLIQLPLTESPVVQIRLPFTVTNFSGAGTGIVKADNGLLYFGYSLDGLVELDPQTLAAVQYKPGNGTIAANTIYRICEDGKKRLWVGTCDGIFEFDKTSKQFIRPAWHPPQLKKRCIQYLLCDSQGNMWISYNEAGGYTLAYYEIATEKLTDFETFKIKYHPSIDFPSPISRMVQDDKGNIWAISLKKGGVACYEPSLGKWSIYATPGKTIKTGEVVGLNAIAVTGNTIWAGNAIGLGLVRYNYRTDSAFSIGRKQGLRSENVLAISKGKGSQLFLATSAGIHLFNTANNEAFPLVTENENIDWSYAYIQYYDSVSNRLFYGLNDRLVVIKNDLQEKKKRPPHTYINKIRIDNNDFSLPATDDIISLTYAQKNISIDFTAPVFNEDEAINYAYRMEGADNNWNLCGEIQTANFSSLSPGNYSFKVKAKLQSGEWGPVNETLRFGVRPPFWQRMSFVLPGLLALTGLIILLVRRRINTVRREAELKHKITEAEMNALRTQMNPHFIFNCLNAIDNLIQTNQKDKATTYLARFAKLIRWVLDSKKSNVVPFQKDYETLQLYLQMEQFRCDNKFEYQLTADPDLQYSDYKVPPLIVQPFVENAIHHGLLNKQHGLRKLTLSAAFDKDFIKYTITDNGVGRVRAQQIKAINKPEHQSYGLNITRERIQLHNQSQHDEDVVITDLYENNEPAGTKVTVRIKIYDTA
jgi:ligand-binding sensor domain-containing protein